MIGRLLIGGLICCAVVLIIVGVWILGSVGVSMKYEGMVVALILSLVVGLVVGLIVGLVGVFGVSFSYGGFKFVKVINNEQE